MAFAAAITRRIEKKDIMSVERAVLTPNLAERLNLINHRCVPRTLASDNDQK